MEAKATQTNDYVVVVDTVRTHIFCRFEIPKTIISNQVSIFITVVSKTFFEGMELCIRDPQLTSHRVMAK